MTFKVNFATLFKNITMSNFFQRINCNIIRNLFFQKLSSLTSCTLLEIITLVPADIKKSYYLI